jgi:hypothetical protein
MTPQAEAIWSGLEFRRPMLLRNVEPLSPEALMWRPGPGRNPIAWQIWHIAEVEDNWIGTLVEGKPPRLPFGVELRAAPEDRYPPKARLLGYLAEVRDLSRRRLEAAAAGDFARRVDDPDFGPLSVLDVWLGVVTSFAWHAGQVALTAKLLPRTPVSTMHFGGWSRHAPPR